jgi:hypothetical protein
MLHSAATAPFRRVILFVTMSDLRETDTIGMDIQDMPAVISQVLPWALYGAYMVRTWCVYGAYM